MAPLLQFAALVMSMAASIAAFDIRLGRKMTIHQAKQEVGQRRESKFVKRDDSDLKALFPAHNISVPVDHFHNETKYEPHSNDTFPLRYFFDATYYKPGGPVIILQSGEADAVERLPFLQKGIVHQLAKATNGIGVVLEHRYYGTSFPTPDLSTKNLRFLTTAQALADEAYFAQNIKFPGLERFGDLTARTTPFIGYGGSYPGAFTAFMRVQYPETIWGAISSSGVTKAIYDYWQYYLPIIESGPSNCINTQQNLMQALDTIWFKNSTALSQQLKTTLGFEGLTHDQDLAYALTTPISLWQSLNWDPAVSSNEFFNYCDNITSSKMLFPDTEASRANVTSLLEEAGFAGDTVLENSFLNLIGYSNLTLVQNCLQTNETLDQCYSTFNQTFYDIDSIEEGAWRSWPYQYCTEWGYLATGDIPAQWNTRPIVSKTIDLEYLSIVCRDAFNITTLPDLEEVNKYGEYDIAYDRLAIIDGNRDPWRDATPHAFKFGAEKRDSVADRPFILMPSGVHHWDENGLFPNETTAELPLEVKDTQDYELFAVEAWLKEWKLHCRERGGCNGMTVQSP